MLTQIKAFLHSENGNTTPELDTILVAYDFTRDLPDSIHKCIVWGHLKDYLSWPDEKRFELIHGIAYAMSPAPSRRHQKISMYISSMFFNYLENKPCEVYAAPFDVRLPDENENDDDIHTVVQPDSAEPVF